MYVSIVMVVKFHYHPALIDKTNPKKLILYFLWKILCLLLMLKCSSCYVVHFFCSLEIMELKILKGLGLQDIITEIHTYIHRS